MNPYEYETTLDCRDVDTRAGGGGGGGLGGGGLNGGTAVGGMMSLRHNPTSTHSHQNTLQHQNQQNLQLQQQQQQHLQQQQSPYDYEYQHLPHRAGELAAAAAANNSGAVSTAQRNTHGRPGYLLEGVTPSAPPDVPPRNPTMSRMNNGRLVPGNPNDLGVDFEPSCLVRTPSGNVYIPSGNLNINKGSPIDYKSGSACSTPTKDTLKGYERSTNNCMGPVLPPRSVMSGLPAHHYSTPMNFRKGLAARWHRWRCALNICLAVFALLGLISIVLYVSGVLHLSMDEPRTILVGNEASEVTAAKSTNTDLTKFGQPTTVTASTATSSLSSISASQAAAAQAASGSADLMAGGGGGGTLPSSTAYQSPASASSAVAAIGTTGAVASSPSSSSLANANNGDVRHVALRRIWFYYPRSYAYTAQQNSQQQTKDSSATGTLRLSYGTQRYERRRQQQQQQSGSDGVAVVASSADKHYQQNTYKQRQQQPHVKVRMPVNATWQQHGARRKRYRRSLMTDETFESIDLITRTHTRDDDDEMKAHERVTNNTNNSKHKLKNGNGDSVDKAKDSGDDSELLTVGNSANADSFVVTQKTITKGVELQLTNKEVIELVAQTAGVPNMLDTNVVRKSSELAEGNRATVAERERNNQRLQTETSNQAKQSTAAITRCLSPVAVSAPHKCQTLPLTNIQTASNYADDALSDKATNETPKKYENIAAPQTDYDKHNSNNTFNSKRTPKRDNISNAQTLQINKLLNLNQNSNDDKEIAAADRTDVEGAAAQTSGSVSVVAKTAVADGVSVGQHDDATLTTIAKVLSKAFRDKNNEVANLTGGDAPNAACGNDADEASATKCAGEATKSLEENKIEDEEYTIADALTPPTTTATAAAAHTAIDLTASDIRDIFDGDIDYVEGDTQREVSVPHAEFVNKVKGREELIFKAASTINEISITTDATASANVISMRAEPNEGTTEEGAAYKHAKSNLRLRKANEPRYMKTLRKHFGRPIHAPVQLAPAAVQFLDVVIDDDSQIDRPPVAERAQRAVQEVERGNNADIGAVQFRENNAISNDNKIDVNATKKLPDNVSQYIRYASAHETTAPQHEFDEVNSTQINRHNGASDNALNDDSESDTDVAATDDNNNERDLVDSYDDVGHDARTPATPLAADTSSVIKIDKSEMNEQKAGQRAAYDDVDDVDTRTEARDDDYDEAWELGRAATESELKIKLNESQMQNERAAMIEKHIALVGVDAETATTTTKLMITADERQTMEINERASVARQKTVARKQQREVKARISVDSGYESKNVGAVDDLLSLENVENVENVEDVGVSTEEATDVVAVKTTSVTDRTQMIAQMSVQQAAETHAAQTTEKLYYNYATEPATAEVLAHTTTMQPTHLSGNGNNASTVADDESNAEDELMLNDGLMPQHNYKHNNKDARNHNAPENIMQRNRNFHTNAKAYAATNDYQHFIAEPNADDIDIIKLEDTRSSEDEIYKTIDGAPAKPPKYTHGKRKEIVTSRPPKYPAQAENEVLKAGVANNAVNSYADKLPNFPLKAPIVSETYDAPGKHILVNVTIATEGDSNSVYTLHVAVPIGGQTHDVQEVLTHERLKTPAHDEDAPPPTYAHDTEQAPISPYCIPEPPPPIPECPCKCADFLSATEVLDAVDNEAHFVPLADSVDNADAPTATATTTAPQTTDNFIHLPYTPAIATSTTTMLTNTTEDSLISTTTTATFTNLLGVDAAQAVSVDDHVVVGDGSKIACPDVMPILILEGARTFPARSFPPDGTTFGQITLGQKLTKEIQPYSYWNMQFYQSEPAYVKFDYTIPRGASIGVYGRRNALPTHTQYHFKEVLSGFSASTRTARAAHLSITREVTRYMEPGHWFVSLYNDDGDAQEVTFYAAIAEDMTQNCPNGCSGNGQCLLGHCQCNPGFGGDDCSESVCPVLCSQHGEYINGECICNPGWKGKECSLRHDECEVADCNGHGHCVSGKCQCMRGYKGKFCEEVDCPHPNCSGHGFCADGTCICKKGWKGTDCATVDKDALQCLPDCSNHGNFDVDTQTCTCEPKWSGDDCSKELCDLDCGQHGRCVGDACTCDTEWGGEYCNTKLCDTRCNEHGQCKNGTCLCVTGWNGKHCTIEGCPNGCSAHGQCRVSGEGQWECRCYEGWDGPDCGIALELNCGDSKDNDKDGLVDCEDPECCASHVCKTSQLCVSAPKPIDVLLRKQPPAITASFFERMKFLIDESSLQNYAKLETFNESRSAVIRGRVVTSLGMGLVGVRVSTTTLLEGFTLTRDDGWFDLMVNGGGAVTLQFGRSPFRPQSRIVQIPWNEVIIIDVVVMSMSEEKNLIPIPHTCFSHDYDLMKPVVLASWKHGFQGACPDRSAILAESQVIQESLQIPGTGLNLVYHSSRAAGYLSTIKLQLTPETIPETLHLIHLRITIEGILFERVFEADPGIKFTYAWNRLNIYRQRVYGVTTAIVKVGYQYSDCKDIIWDIQTTKLSGHDMSISEVGGWNLDIHHRYNFHEGILQKGDGSNIYLKNKPRVILTTMGDGHQRPLECNDCEGLAYKQRLLAPVALAASPDGSLYVGDFNYIRRIMTDGTIRTVVKLNATRVSYRYHMALSPLDGTLYISDPESHQIIRVRDTNDYSQPEKNWEPIVGSGERCLPGDEAHCGDGALAKDAKLAYPKGIAISSDNILYFADGTNIRMVDRDGIVTTLIGNHMHKSHWKPIPCEGTLKLEEMHLRWPTELAVSPLDNTLHIIDDHMILRMTPDGRVRVISGRPLHCATTSTVYDSDLATHATLVMPQSISFGPMGELYVAESDSQRINRVRVIGTDGRIAPFAGAESKCNCLERGCDCFEAEHFLATSAKFNTIAALSVTPDGHVHIADQANYRIRSVMSSIPEASASREYEIYAPDMQEIYIFNRFGQHVSTKNILTGETTYVFTYNVNTSNGKLSTVTDAAGNKVFLLRDYTSQVNSIENTKGQKCRLRMTRMKMLHELSTPDNYNVTFEYHGPTGLLKTKLDSTGRSYVYNYDEFGRLTSAVTPTGRVIDLVFDLSVKGAQVKISENAQKEQSMLIQGSTVMVRNGAAESKTSVEMDGSMTSLTPWGHTVQMEVVPYAILAEINPVIGESYPVPAKQRTEIAGDLANRFEWRYFVRRMQQGKQGKGPRPVSQVGRKLRVNGDNVLTLEYDRDAQSVVVLVDDKQELLNVTYDRTARPVSFRPQSGDYADVDLEYDRFGRLVSWKWGVLQEAYTFDRNGRLNEIKYGDGSSMVYAFKDMFGSLPLKVTTPRRSDYLLQYDDAGALQSLTTPRGHIHSFSLQTSLGFFKYQYFSPINRHPFEILYNDEGQILAKIHPHQSGKVAFVHDSAGRLETILAGLSSTHYTYQDTTSLIKSVEVQEPGFELRREFKYHAGILKDEKVRFGSKNSLASAHYKYFYDGNARLSSIEMSIDDKEVPTARYKYSQNLGQLEVVQDLKITRNAFNRTVIQDSAKQFFTIIDYDQHGRVKSVLMNIKSFDVFRLELDYDLRNRIKSQKTTLGRSTSFDKINYNADGHVTEVLGTNNWKYLYDENGNTVGIVDQGEKINLSYDIGDRVIQVGEIEFNSYDARGFVVRRGEQKYRYNNRGQLIHAFERDRFQSWYYYDDRSRLIAWHDSKGNVTQYYYANPKTPKLLTHVHFPKVGKTLRFFYDDRDMLMAVENGDQRYYVATDQNGSPLAFFDPNGIIIKDVRRTPFGRIIKDTNPDFFIPIDFHGGLLDPNTKLIYTEGRHYDPTVGQWMTPKWETLATEMSNPTDVFIYRYHNNDPVNPNKPQNYMIDLESWLQLFGYDLRSMQSSKYTKDAQYVPQISIKSNTLAPEFGVISGLECIVEKTNEKFSDFDFVPKPLLKMEPKMRNLLPRISYRRGVFGEGVLLSRIGGRALVSVVDGSNSVVQDVVSSVFNNSYFLDLHFSIHDQDVFYFVKDNVLKLRDDNEELRRLGGMFNISTHEVTDHGGTAAKELRLHGPDAVVIIKYGVDPEQERHRILKHAHKRAVERAWELEKQLVAAGFQGRGDWTEEEKEELVSHGDVDGWIGIDIHSIHKYPQLADDPGNVAFQRDAKRKRRKIGSAHRAAKSRRQQLRVMDLSA
ncbi:teneurin-m isoform X2 [Bactrocera dorsalis]|uniref:Teneurin-m isoform X2 n=1 Tax=Bactrocera dorsalis TaxID=27457 RepID=A0ABM3JVE6_BACDO|nr:teneurin-m isoform X2 [Bactrocera dorsalis]